MVKKLNLKTKKNMTTITISTANSREFSTMASIITSCVNDIQAENSRETLEFAKYRFSEIEYNALIWLTINQKLLIAMNEEILIKENI
jgi:hypothetical protein